MILAGLFSKSLTMYCHKCGQLAALCAAGFELVLATEPVLVDPLLIALVTCKPAPCAVSSCPTPPSLRRREGHPAAGDGRTGVRRRFPESLSEH